MALSLEDFLIRARVLKLYRHALRISRRAPSQARADLRQIIRHEMEINRNCNDKQRIRFLISDGLERVKRLDEMLDMQGTTKMKNLNDNVQSLGVKLTPDDLKEISDAIPISEVFGERDHEEISKYDYRFANTPLKQ